LAPTRDGITRTGVKFDWSPFPQEIGPELASGAGKAPRDLVVGRLFDEFNEEIARSVLF
jgi:hypothetical protein